MSEKFPKLYEFKQIIVKSVTPQWVKWEDGKPEISLTPRKAIDGFKKSYRMKFNKGEMDISPNSLASMLEACFGAKEAGKSDISGAIFDVVAKQIFNADGTPKLFKSGGKEYPTYNYFFNFKGYIQETFYVEDEIDEDDEFNGNQNEENKENKEDEDILF